MNYEGMKAAMIIINTKLSAADNLTISMKPDSCPLCGGKAEVVEYKHNRVAIECKKCLLSTRSVRCFNDNEFQLIQEWNSRFVESEGISDTVKYILFFIGMVSAGIIAFTINNGG